MPYNNLPVYAAYYLPGAMPPWPYSLPRHVTPTGDVHNTNQLVSLVSDANCHTCLVHTCRSICAVHVHVHVHVMAYTPRKVRRIILLHVYVHQHLLAFSDRCVTTSTQSRTCRPPRRRRQLRSWYTASIIRPITQTPTAVLCASLACPNPGQKLT